MRFWTDIDKLFRTFCCPFCPLAIPNVARSTFQCLPTMRFELVCPILDSYKRCKTFFKLESRRQYVLGICGRLAFCSSIVVSIRLRNDMSTYGWIRSTLVDKHPYEFVQKPTSIHCDPCERSTLADARKADWEKKEEKKKKIIVKEVFVCLMKKTMMMKVEQLAKFVWIQKDHKL